MTQMVPVLKAALVVIRIYSYRHVSGEDTVEEWKTHGVAFLVERHEGRVVDLDDGIAVGVDEREVLPNPLSGGDPVDSPCQPIYNAVNYMGRRFWR